MSSIFGGSQNSTQSQGQSQSNSSSQSSNQAYPMLSQALGGQVNTGSAANSSLSALLGVGGGSTAQQQQAQQQAFQNFQGSTGYQFGLNQGLQGVSQNAATSGLLDSGATAKALDTYGSNYANTQYQNYTNQLQNLNNTGNQAGSVISGAGQQSSSQAQSQSVNSSNGSGSTKPGIGGFVGGLLGGG